MPAAAQYKFESKVPAKGDVLNGVSLDNFKLSLDHSAIDRIEGVWHYVDDGVTVGIVRFTHPDFAPVIKYRIILLECEDMRLVPGSVIGYIADSAQPDKSYIWIYSGTDANGVPVRPVKCIATLSGESLTFSKTKPFKFRVRVNFSHFMPSFFKALSVSGEKNSDALPLGFVKLYPAAERDDDAPGAQIIDNKTRKIRYL